jgi:Xaa-Pro dipeptidase
LNTLFGIAESSTPAEVAAKLASVRALMAEIGAPGVVLTSTGAVAWLSAGLTNRIEAGSTASAMWIVVTPTDAVALTTNVERPRIEAEHDLPARGLQLAEIEWFAGGAGFVAAACEVAGHPAGELASDAHAGFGIDADDALAARRLALLPSEQQRLSALAIDAAGALELTLRHWRPGDRDLDLQARIAAELELVGAFGACLIVGGDERVERFRHPLAAGEPVHRLLMAVVVAMRGGLHVAATRFACANGLTDSARAAFEAAREVEAAMLAANSPGATYGDVLRTCEQAYADAGYSGAWHEHYQGGPIGYRQREFELAPSQRESRWFSQPIEPGHAVAWNPSVAGGGKSEDTFLVEDDGLRCVTETGAWPLVQVRGGSPRSGVLEIAR